MMTPLPKNSQDDPCDQQVEEQLIKEIDQDTIKFIAAGEKVSDIETAIRELIENSIDAEAKCIEIRLAKFGVDAIEVEDNGIGIDESDFGSIAMRYHTSKIIDYKNLQENLETFGFRGEALSCLCNISSVMVFTKTKKSPTGWRLAFNQDGTVGKKEPVGRDTGTTVIVKNLFKSLPVRRRELEINAKKHYDKIIRLIYEQVLARPHIKFSLCRKIATRKEKEFTHGGSTLEGCIITIFGINVLDSLMPIRQAGIQYADQIKREQPYKPKTSIIDNDINNETDSVNRKLEMSSANVEDDLAQDSDMNIDIEQSNGTSPTASTTCDPSSQLTDDEPKSMLPAPVAPNVGQSSRGGGSAFFKRSCRSKFARERPDYSIYGYISKIFQGRNSADCQYLFVNRKPCDIPRLSRLINEVYRNYSKDQHPFYCLFIKVQTWAADFNVPRKRLVILQEESKLCDIVRDSLEKMFSPCVPASQKSCPIAHIPMLTIPKQNATLSIESSSAKTNEQPQNSECQNKEINGETPKFKNALDVYIEEAANQNMNQSNFFSNDDQMNPNNGASDTNPRHDKPKQAKSNRSCNGKRPTTPILPYPIPGQPEQEPSPSTPMTSALSPQQPAAKRISPAKSMKNSPPPPPCRFQQHEMVQNGNLAARIDYLEDLAVALERERAQRKLTDDSREFSFAIDPKFNTVAEEQLKFNLNKTSFQGMQVMGQFNKGFIIARLNKHLFIIDQHATDERANFEDQLEKSPVEKQVMIHPKPLFLNLIQENAILNNMDAFVKRGFEFTINKEAMIGYRIMLAATSICKGIGRDEHLGKEDVEELIDVILESPNRLESYTLKKVREVAASKACRKSVMIGDSLTWAQMTNIVSKMSNLQNPWICAHNRPTIRHLMDVDWL